jgi:hypothetical protein
MRGAAVNEQAHWLVPVENEAIGGSFLGVLSRSSEQARTR